MTRSRNRRLRLIPSHLPLIRDKLAEYERVALKEEMAAHSQYERSMEAAWNFADNLAVAQLWWISRDMTALAEDTVRAGDFPKSEAPAQSGLIFFDGDVQMVRFPVTDDATGRKVGDAHVSALFWQCDGNGDIELMGFTDHPCALKECDAKSFSLPVIRFANGIFNEHVGGFRWFGDLLRAKRTHIEVFAAYGNGMRPAAKNTVYRNLSVVCCLYRYLYEEGYIDSDPGEHVRRPKLYGHSDGTYLTREQARLFMDEARGMDARTDALCSLLLLTGARVSEALGLDVEDCHLNDGRPWVRFDRKGDWSQRVAIPSDASKALARLVGGRRRGAVFREDSGARLRQQTAVGIVSSVALRVGVPDISPHSLRRTFCTLSRDAGVPDRDIMAAGGWSSPQMLDYYDMSRRGLNGKAGDGLQDYLGKED